MRREGLGCRLGKRSARPDGRDPAIRLNHIALAAEQEGLVPVRDEQQGLQMPQELVSTPILGELDGRAAEVSMVLLQLRFEAAEERKRIRSRSSKARQDLVL